MIRDENTERVIKEHIKPLKSEINKLKKELKELKDLLINTSKAFNYRNLTPYD